MRLFSCMTLWICAAAVFCGCGNSDSTARSSSDETSPGQPAAFDLNTAVLLDVRSPEEYASGHLQGARNIPHDRIEAEIASVAPDKSAPVILYCRSGRRADTALKAMRSMGYENVSNFGGLEDARKRLGIPVEK